MKYFFPILTLLVGLVVSFSVFGFGSIFSGAKIPAMILAGSLGAAKLVGAAVLKRFWKDLPNFLSWFLLLAVVIIMVITSLGIYGYLSNAYQQTNVEYQIQQKKIELVERKKEGYKKLKESEEINLNTTLEAIKNLTYALNNKVEYLTESGEKISTTSSANRRVVKELIDIEYENRDKTQNKISVYSDSINNLDIQILNLESNSEQQSELSTLIYVSNVTGWSMDLVVNYFTLLIIFVFDPVAVAFILLSTVLFMRIGREEDNKTATIEDRTVEESPSVPVDDQLDSRLELDSDNSYTPDDTHVLMFDSVFSNASDIQNGTLESYTNNDLENDQSSSIIDRLTGDVSSGSQPEPNLDGNWIKPLSDSEIKNMGSEQLAEYKKMIRSSK
jgi:uncharacterized membrane-anchored protein YhcB (DUF1043 family)